MKVIVDREKCPGVGNCVAMSPTVFDLDDDNKAIILDVTSVGEDALQEAAESCPRDAIILQDDEGNQVYP